MRVIIGETAIADIDALAAWIAKDSAQSGQLVVEKILHTIARLELFPKIGHEGRDEGTYERGVPGTLAVYEVREKPSAVLVIAVVHGARDR
jgi:plasmid stabilization system protein ParE